MKPKPKDEEKNDFDKITELAGYYPISVDNLRDIDMDKKRKYIGALAYLIFLDESDRYGRLLYVNRLSKGIGYDVTAEQIYILGMELVDKPIDVFINNIREFKELYILEAIIIANVSKAISNSIMMFISDIAQLIALDKESIKILAIIAKSYITQEVRYLYDLPNPQNNYWINKFGSIILEEYLNNKRCLCGVICVDKSDYTNPTYIFSHRYEEYERRIQNGLNFEKNVPDKINIIKKQEEMGKAVNKGDLLLEGSYDTSKTHGGVSESVSALFSFSSNRDNANSIYAKEDGIVFYYEYEKKSETNGNYDTYIEVYVVSYFDDFNCFMKWRLKKDVFSALKNFADSNNNGV